MATRRDRVLVVDDAANLRDLLTVVLEAEDDFEVVGTASDGEQALLAAADLQPDIVLLDLLMPIMDGLQAMAREALSAGADQYLEKGVSVTRLISFLRELRGRPDPEVA